MTTSLEIVLATTTPVGRAERLSRLDPTELRNKAVKACRDHDGAALWDITEAYLITRGRKGARISTRTLTSYRDSIGRYITWALPAGVVLLRPKASDGFAYVRQLEAADFKPSTVQVRLSGAKALYAALRWIGATDAVPFEDVRAARDPRAAWEKRTPYSEEEVEKLLAVADPQEKVIVLLAADCGLRNSEMLAIRQQDIQFNAEHPYVLVQGKGRAGYQESAPLSRRAEEAIRQWLSNLPPSFSHLLTWRTTKSVQNHISALCARSGVSYQGKEVHGLRHTAGTRVYNQTSNIVEVKEFLRHRDIASTQVYVHYARRGKKSANRDW